MADRAMAWLHQAARPLVLIMLVAAFIAGWWTGRVQPAAFESVVLMAVGYYFGQRQSDQRSTDR